MFDHQFFPRQPIQFGGGQSAYNRTSGSTPTMPTFVDAKVNQSYTDKGGWGTVAAFSSSNAGDMFVVIYYTGSTPSGYTDQDSVVVNGVTFTVATKVRTTGSEAHGVPSTNAGVIIYLMRNVDPTTPVADIQGAYLSTNNTTVNFAAITTANDNSMVLMAGKATSASLTSSASFGDLTSVTERVDPGSTGDSGNGGFFVGYTGEKAAAGSVGAGTMTLANNRSTKYGIVVALNGAS